MGSFLQPGMDLTNALSPSQGGPQTPAPNSPGLQNPLQQLPVSAIGNPMAQQINPGQAPFFSRLGAGLAQTPIGQIVTGHPLQGLAGLGNAISQGSRTGMNPQGMGQTQNQGVGSQFLQQQKKMYDMLQQITQQMRNSGRSTGSLDQMTQSAQQASQDDSQAQ